MRDVIDTLESQHKALEGIAGEVITAFKAQNETSLRDALGRLRRLLDAHLELERTQFYPAFVELAEKRDEMTHKLAVLFRDNMKVIADGVQAFFKRADEGMSHEQLRKELKNTLAVLGQRMVDEEKTLHPMLRRLLG